MDESELMADESLRRGAPEKPLAGRRVLVPRGGPWGDGVAALLRAQGANPVVAPLINFAPTTDHTQLERALADLASGAFDWLTITSIASVDVLLSYDARLAPHTQVAAVSDTTAAALQLAGYRVDLVPEQDNSSGALADALIERETEPRTILALRGEASRPILPDRLEAAGHHVHAVVAYRTVGVAVDERIADDVRSGRINAILVTSGSVAEQVRQQFPDIPASTVIAAIGPRTASDARRSGLGVDVVAENTTLDALVDAVATVPLPHATDEFPT